MSLSLIVMKKKICAACILAGIIFLSSLTGFAEADTKKKKKRYSSSTSFSALLTAGNNKDVTISFDTNQNLKFKRDSFNFRAHIIYAKSNHIKKSEIYSTTLKYNRQFNKRAYFLGMTRYSRNILSGYNSRIAVSAGAGYTWLQKKKANASSELAFGWSSEKNAEIVAQQMFGSHTLPIKRAAKATFASSILSTKLNVTLSPNTLLSHTEILFLNLSAFSGYRITSYSSLATSINKHFALKTSLQINYENKPVLGHKNTDLYILSSIVFKL